ncbi:MAG: ABC-2 family transporter protein [Oscillospiraceae bacterium]|nr:ABC-2 family transporter protein [Oscillospiraceae bacterium]
MNIKAGIALIKLSFQEISAYRLYFIFQIISSFFYTAIIFFLWKAIYAASGDAMINGTTFNETFVQLGLAGTLINIINTYCEWIMSDQMRSGDISISFTRPVSYRTVIMSKGLGDIITNFLIMFVPGFIVVWLLTGQTIHLGANLVLFLASFALASYINLLISFMTGIIAFYTESVWGIITMKEAVVTLLSGAVIPLAFFPDTLRTIVSFLPFQAIFNIPLQILTNSSYTAADYSRSFIIQIIWLIILFVLSELFYRHASKSVVINGG